MITLTVAFSRERDKIKLIFLLSVFMVQFFHRELVVAIKVYGPVVLVIECTIWPVKKCVCFSKDANIRTFLKKCCYL